MGMNEKRRVLLVGVDADALERYGDNEAYYEEVVIFSANGRDKVSKAYRAIANNLPTTPKDVKELVNSLTDDELFSLLSAGRDTNENGDVVEVMNPNQTYDEVFEPSDGVALPLKSGGFSVKSLVGDVLFFDDTVKGKLSDIYDSLDEGYKAMFASKDEYVTYNTARFVTEAVVDSEGWHEFDATKQNDVEWVCTFKELVEKDKNASVTLYEYTPCRQ